MSFARLRDPVVETLARGGVVAALGRSAFYERLTDGARPFIERARCAGRIAAGAPEPRPGGAAETQ